MRNALPARRPSSDTSTMATETKANGQMPRSLAYCYEKIVSNLSFLGRENVDGNTAQDTASAIRDTLKTRAIRDIMDQGLHEFLEDFVAMNNKLGYEISKGYRFDQ